VNEVTDVINCDDKTTGDVLGVPRKIGVSRWTTADCSDQKRDHSS